MTSVVYVPGGSSSTVLGKDLVTPVADPAGGTAGVVISDLLNLDNTTDNAGTTPNTGMTLAAGRWRATFRLSGGGNITIRARNITDSLDTATRTVGLESGAADHVLEFDAVAGKGYQLQVDDPTNTGTPRVYSITHEFLPSLGLNESVRTDPIRYAVDRLDSSGNLSGYLNTEGPVPLMLKPGENHIMIRCDEVPLAGYDEPENKLARTPTVSVIYSPRYAL